MCQRTRTSLYHRHLCPGTDIVMTPEDEITQLAALHNPVVCDVLCNINVCRLEIIENNVNTILMCVMQANVKTS